MKLQISFDVTDLDDALHTAQQVAESCDILEVGNLLIYRSGIHAIEKFRQAFPSKTLLADVKIVDFGKEIVSLLAEAGVDWITLMAGTDQNIIHTTCTAASNHNIKIMLDLLDAPSAGQSAMEAKALGVDALLFHQPYGAEDEHSYLERWDMVRGNTNLPIFVSGHIKQENIDDILKLNPAGIVVGRSITQSNDPKKEAAYFYQEINK